MLVGGHHCYKNSMNQPLREVHRYDCSTPKPQNYHIVQQSYDISNFISCIGGGIQQRRLGQISNLINLTHSAAAIRLASLFSELFLKSCDQYDRDSRLAFGISLLVRIHSYHPPRHHTILTGFKRCSSILC